jgi:hypothetical protein
VPRRDPPLDVRVEVLFRDVEVARRAPDVRDPRPLAVDPLRPADALRELVERLPLTAFRFPVERRRPLELPSLPEAMSVPRSAISAI